jgi:hypothetical protein
MKLGQQDHAIKLSNKLGKLSLGIAVGKTQAWQCWPSTNIHPHILLYCLPTPTIPLKIWYNRGGHKST